MNSKINFNEMSLTELYSCQKELQMAIKEAEKIKKTEEWNKFVQTLSDYMSFDNKEIELEICDRWADESTFVQLNFNQLDFSEVNKIKLCV